MSAVVAGINSVFGGIGRSVQEVLAAIVPAWNKDAAKIGIVRIRTGVDDGDYDFLVPDNSSLP